MTEPESAHVTEDEILAKWQEMAPLIDRMLERMGANDEFPVAPGSSLAGDDRATNPYQTSHALRMCLTAGVDHLHAVKSLVVDHGVLHLAAPSSLARGALENFAAAYWILGPQLRAERVTRTLRWYAQNFRDEATALQAFALTGNGGQRRKLDRLLETAEKAGIDPKSVKGGYRSTDAIVYTENVLPEPTNGVVFPWRLCSGFAHGRPWAYLSSLDVEERAVSATGALDLRLSSDVGRALYPNLMGMHLLQDFLTLYAKRAASHLD